MQRRRMVWAAAVALCVALPLASWRRAVWVTEHAFAVSPASGHVRSTALVAAAPRPGAAPRLVWRIGYSWRGQEPIGLYVTPLGAPVGSFPLGLRR